MTTVSISNSIEFNLVVEVYNSTSQPAGYSRIYGTGAQWIFNDTDANGRLELNVSAGTYTLCACSSTYDFVLVKPNIVVNVGTVTTVVFNASEGTVPVKIRAKNPAGGALEGAGAWFALVGTTINPWAGYTDAGGEMVVRVYPNTYHVGLWRKADEAYYLYKTSIPVAGPLNISFEPTLVTEAVLQPKFHNITLNQRADLALLPRTIQVDLIPLFYGPSTVVSTADTYDVFMRVVSDDTWQCEFWAHNITLIAGSSKPLELGGHLWLSLKAGGSYKPGSTVNVFWNLTDSYCHEVTYLQELLPGTAEQYAHVRQVLSTLGRAESSWREYSPRLEIRDPRGNLLLNDTLGWGEKPYPYRLPSGAEAGVYGVKMLVNTGAYEGVMVAEHRFKVLEPDVTIYTDKPVYRPSDNMTISIRLSNMGSGRTLRFCWYLYLYGWYPVGCWTSTLPTGMDQTYRFTIHIPDLGGTSFYAAWVVALTDPYTNKIINLDYVFWQYLPPSGDPTTAEQFANRMAEAARNATSQALPKAP